MNVLLTPRFLVGALIDVRVQKRSWVHLQSTESESRIGKSLHHRPAPKKNEKVKKIQKSGKSENPAAQPQPPAPAPRPAQAQNQKSEAFYGTILENRCQRHPLCWGEENGSQFHEIHTLGGVDWGLFSCWGPEWGSVTGH